MKALIHKFVLTWRERFRSQRSELFLRLMKPQDGMSILDLGGGNGDFMARIRDRVKARFVVADIFDSVNTAHKDHLFEFVRLPENGVLPFADQEFDIVFCNSVIEHVTLPKSELGLREIDHSEWIRLAFERQQQFANEIRRIGKSHFVQTPHKSFPIETHIWLPFVNWLHYNQMVAVLKLANRWWVKKYGYVDWYLLGSKEMQQLFPESNIHVERFLGLPKSIIAFQRTSNDNT